MVSQKVKLQLINGLHARPVSKVVAFAEGRTSSFMMIYNGEKGDCKSAISLLSLAVGPSAEVEIQVEGKDEETDLKEFVEFLTQLEH